MTNLDSMLKSRDITLPTKVHLVKAMIFPVVMYGRESWTLKKAECQRTDAFELWCWRRLLRVPWLGKKIQPVHPKGNQSWMFIGRTHVKAETPILWPFLMRRTDSLEKTLMLGKTEGRRRRGRQSMRWLEYEMAWLTWWAWVLASSRSWWRTGKPGVLHPNGLQRVGNDWASELNDNILF